MSAFWRLFATQGDSNNHQAEICNVTPTGSFLHAPVISSIHFPIPRSLPPPPLSSSLAPPILLALPSFFFFSFFPSPPFAHPPLPFLLYSLLSSLSLPYTPLPSIFLYPLPAPSHLIHLPFTPSPFLSISSLLSRCVCFKNHHTFILLLVYIVRLKNHSNVNRSYRG